MSSTPQTIGGRAIGFRLLFLLLLRLLPLSSAWGVPVVPLFCVERSSARRYRNGEMQSASNFLGMAATTDNDQGFIITKTEDSREEQAGEDASFIAEHQAISFLENFEEAWNTRSGLEIVQNYFVSNEPNNGDENVDETTTPFWRDMVAFTWNIVTNEGPDAISRAIDATTPSSTSKGSSHPPFSRWRISSEPTPPSLVPPDSSNNGGLADRNTAAGVEFWANLEIEGVGMAKAHFRLTSNGRIRTLLTVLRELSGCPFRIGSNRVRGQIEGPIPKRKYWPEHLRAQQEEQLDALSSTNGSEDDEPVDWESTFCIIVGGGQAGLALGARLHSMEVPYVILEAGDRPGTAWRKRYPSLHLHDPVWYNHMPYLPFPETWPILCPRDKIADWMEFYAKAMDLNVHTHTKVTRVVRPRGASSSSSNMNPPLWEVHCSTTTKATDASGNSIETTRHRLFRAQHVVFATGNSSKPRAPKIPGDFSGFQLHSSQYRGGRDFANQRVVVVGSNNSGFDIVQDLWEQGAKSVTMIQRSPSMVVSTESVLQHGLGPLYRQDAPLHHEDADLVATTMPYKLLMPRWKAVNQDMRETDKALHEGLLAAGYQLEYGPDEMGIFAKSATEGGGFYIDMGCAELVTNGKVHTRYATLSRLEGAKVVILDQKTGKEDHLVADAVIYATGFETLDRWVAKLCGEEVASRIGRTWGLGLGMRPHKDPSPWEGELRNMWKPTTVDGLWFHGGNLAQSRYYSRLVALQLAARFTGIATQVYGIPPPTKPNNTDGKGK